MSAEQEAASDGMADKVSDIPVSDAPGGCAGEAPNIPVEQPINGSNDIPVDPDHGGVDNEVDRNDVPPEEDVAGAVQMLRQAGKFGTVADYLESRLT